MECAQAKATEKAMHEMQGKHKLVFRQTKQRPQKCHEKVTCKFVTRKSLPNIFDKFKDILNLWCCD